MVRPFKAWRDLRVLPAAVWVLVLATFINRLGAMALPFLTLYLVRFSRLEVTAAAGMLGLYGATALVAGPIAGRLCDRFGATRVMIASLSASGIALCLYPLAHSIPALAALTVCWSLAAETFRPASMARLAGLVGPAHRKQAFALQRLGVNLGMSVGPAAAGFLAEISFPSIFVVDGVTSLLAVVLFAFARGGSADDDPREASSAPRDWLPFGALADPKLALALTALLPLAVVFFQSESTVPLLLVRDRHFSPALYGAMFTVNTVLIVLFEIPLNASIAKWSHRRVLSIGAVFGGVGFAATALARSIVELTLAVVLWTIGEMIYSPAMTTYIADIAPPHRRGQYLGLYTMTFSIGFIVAPWTGLLTLEHFGPTGFAIAMAITGLLAAALFARLEGPAQETGANEAGDTAPSSG